MKIGVVIATLGRREDVGVLVARLAEQTCPATRIIVSASTAVDVAGLENDTSIEIVIGSPGSCIQRNRALELLLDDTDIVCFLDDDYLPSRFAFEAIQECFDSDPSMVGVNGVLLADGIHGKALSVEACDALLSRHDALGRPAARIVCERDHLYGCNMAFRTSAIGAVRFDERLPLYGWQEDVDFSSRIARQGRMAQVDGFVGVHRGVTRGRSPGYRLGYSQIVNPFYLWRKGTMTLGHASRISFNNFIANHLKMLKPEPWIDRRGRARGNRLALADILRRKADPQRILDL